MAIRKVTKLVKGVEKEVLGLDDILDQIGGRRGDSIDFLGLAEVLNIPLTLNSNPNPITLPDSFIGEDLNLDAPSATANPTSLSYESTGGSKTVSIVSNGTYRISSFPSWLSADRTFARGNRTFTFTAFDNSDLNTSNRSGDIVFSAGTELVRVSVSQAGNPIVATIEPNTNQTVPSTADSDNIIVRLSDSLSIYPASITNEDGFTLSEPNITTSGGVVTYTYSLEWDATDLSRSTTFSINFYGSGYSDTLDVTYNQQEFAPTIDNLTPTELNFPSAGQTLSYSFESNTTWTATISSPSFAFKHSLQSDRNFTIDDITSSGDKTIYVKIGGNGAGGREGTSTITTTYSRDNVTKTVDLAQAAAEQWDDNDIFITSDFLVASDGTITEPGVETTGDTPYTIEYSDTATFASTITSTDSFDLVSSDTERYARISVIVPSGYGNTGETFIKVLDTIQGGLPTFQSKQITMESTQLFRVNSYGAITEPSVSVPSGITYTLRYTTGNNNTGTAYSSQFPKVSTEVTRYATAIVIVPAGYFNEGNSVIKTVDDIQEVFDPTLEATTPNGFDSLAFPIDGDTLSFVVTSNYTWTSTISTLGDDVFEQSFSQTSGFTTNNLTGGITSLESGTRNTTIYVRAPKNLVDSKVGSVQVETNFGSLDSNDSVMLTQDGEPTFDFDTHWDGVVTISADGTVSVTNGNSLTTPTFTPASFARVSATTDRDVSVTITVPAGWNNHNSELTGTKTVSQPKFVPTLALSHTARSFTAGGSTTYYDVKDVGTNTTWTATITGAGFEHSTSQTSGFKTTAIEGFEFGGRIYVRATGHEGAERTGIATVTTTQGWNDVSKEVDLTQAAAPTFGANDITVGTTTAFDVNSHGSITEPSVSTTNDIDYTITYTTGKNSGTEYTSSFPKVSVDTTRYSNVSVTIPSGYQSSGTVITKTVSATQEDFDPTLVLTTPNTGVLPEFTIGSQTKSFSFTSNYSWVSNISGDGFEQSKDNSTFTTDDLTGSGNDTIYVKALKNTGEPRGGSVGVSTNFGHLDNSIAVLLSQDGEPTFDIGDWDGTVSISSTGVVSATKGNSLTNPTFTPTSFAKVSAATNRTVSVTVKAPDGYNNHNSLITGDVTVSQPYFDPTLSIAVADLTFTNTTTEQVKYFDVVSNHSWVSTLTNNTGAKFRQSLSPTTGFTTNDLNGSGNYRIYIKALVQDNDGDERTGLVSVATDFTNRNNSDSVDLTQNASPNWTSSNISVTGFDVNSNGVITQPTITTTGTSITTTYTYGPNIGTAVTAAAGFPLVSTDTTRYCNVTATAPAGFRNATTATATKTVSATQEEKFYGSDEISISGFSVNSSGMVTEPTVSATGVPAADITITYDLGDKVLPGNTPGYYPPVLTDRARSVTASVTVPSGWYNSTETQSRTATDTQEATTLSGHIFQPYTSTVERTIFEIGGVGGDYTLSNFWSATETATKYLSFSLRTNVAASYTASVTGIGGSLRTGPYYNTNLAEYTFSSQSTYNSTSKPEHFRVYITAPSAGGSRRISVMLNTTTVTGKNLTFDIVATRTASSGTGSGGGVVNPKER